MSNSLVLDFLERVCEKTIISWALENSESWKNFMKEK